MLQLWDGHKLLSRNVYSNVWILMTCLNHLSPSHHSPHSVMFLGRNEMMKMLLLLCICRDHRPAALYLTAATWPGSGGGYVPIPARQCCWCCCCGLLAPALTDTMTVYVCFTPLPWRSVKQTHPVPIKRNRKSAGYSFAVCQKAKTDINKICICTCIDNDRPW